MPRGGAGSRLLHPGRASAHAVRGGQEERVFDGEAYILERGIRADLSIIKGWRATRAQSSVPQDGTQLQPANGHGRPTASPRSRDCRGRHHRARLGPAASFYVKRILLRAPTTRGSNSARFVPARRRDPIGSRAGPARAWRLRSAGGPAAPLSPSANASAASVPPAMHGSMARERGGGQPAGVARLS